MAKVVFLNKNHVKSVAKLHLLSFPGKLLTLFNQPLLEKIYCLLLEAPGAYLLGFFEKNKLAGIVVCTLNTSQLFSQLFRKLVLKIISNPVLFIQCFYQTIIRPQIIFQIFSLLLYPSKNKLNLPEILVITVDQQYRRQNIGTQLIKNLEQHLQKKRISSYKVSVESTNKAGQKFYRKLGFKQRSTVRQFDRTWFVLVKKIT